MNGTNPNDRPRPKPKRSHVKPDGEVSPYLRAIVSQVRSYVWTHEARWDESKRAWIWGKPARSPKTQRYRKIRWSAENFEKDEHLWGDFQEARLAYEKDRDYLQGIGVLVEPDRTVEFDGEERLPVWIDFDDCRSIDTGEVDPAVMGEVRRLDTYTELSPSGEGLRCVGWGKRHPGSWTFIEIDGHRVEVYGGGMGGRHLITITGQPLEGYDRPVRGVQHWIDERVPLKPVAPEDGNLAPEPLDLPDREILRRMLASRDGKLIEGFMDGQESLWKGEGARYGSRSDADLGFFRKLAFYTRGQRDRMRRIALSSKMRREKWNRAGYLDDAIELGIGYCRGGFYEPDYSSKDELVEGFFEVWMGLRDSKVRGAFGALLAHANAYGWYTREGFVVKAHGEQHVVPEEGLMVFASLRSLGLWMGEGEVPNISRMMKDLREGGLASRISRGKGSKGSLYLLPSALLASIDSDLQHRRGTQGGGPDTHPCASLLCCKNESIYKKLMWVRNPKGKAKKKGLTHDQKIVIQLVLMGRITGPEDLAKILGKRKNNLTSRVITPLLEMGLLERDGRDSLKIPEGFEQALHGVFVSSGGEKQLEEARARFKREGEKYQQDLARIDEQIRNIVGKGQLDFMEIDFARLSELETKRAYLLAGGKEEEVGEDR